MAAKSYLIVLLLSFGHMQACSTQEVSVQKIDEEPVLSTKQHNKGEKATVKNKNEEVTAQNNTYVGMWVTADGHIRQELLPNGRYDEARGSKKSAYTGSYTINGNRIDYADDTGFTADGEFRDGILYHAGMIFYREEQGRE